MALVLREGDGGIEILFLRRADDPADPWSVHMAFPGGRSEPGDADLRATAMRETREEIGLDLGEIADLLGALDEVRAMARMQPLDLAIAPFVFRLRGPHAELTPSAEVTSVHWIRLEDLLGSRFRASMTYSHEGRTIEFPCLQVDDLVIWGLTYRMFTSFAERLGR